MEARRTTLADRNVEVRTEPTRRNPADFQFVKLHIDSGVARMTLSRPDHNLLNENMLREMADGIAHVGDRHDVKLILLDSACKVFCGGIDVGEYTTDRVFQMLDAFHSVFTGILETSKPVICVVNGPAIGGGAELAAFGDMVIATPKGAATPVPYSTVSARVRDNAVVLDKARFEGAPKVQQYQKEDGSSTAWEEKPDSYWKR